MTEASLVVDLPTIQQSLQRIRPYLPASAVKESVYLAKRLGLRVFLKLENLNLSGSFKIRGALNALLQLRPEELSKGILAASAGNHAQGVAYTCKMLGAQAHIFMPERSPLVKVEATRELGANVTLVGQAYDDAYRAARAYEAVHGGFFLHGFQDPRVIAGQGTIGLELLEQVPDLGMVIGSIGGGGMMAGVAAALKASKPEVQVVGVQSMMYPAMARSVAEHRAVACANGYTIADGIAIKEPAEETFRILERFVDHIALVEEDEIASAVMLLMERDHALAEGAGAAPVAALLKLPPERLAALKGKSVVCIISGGNIDVNLLRRIIPNGLKHSGRLVRLAVRIQDRPGRLAELLNVVSRAGANLQDVAHNRLFGAVAYEDVEVQLDIETTNESHRELVLRALTEAKFKYVQLD